MRSSAAAVFTMSTSKAPIVLVLCSTSMVIAVAASCEARFWLRPPKQ